MSLSVCTGFDVWTDEAGVLNTASVASMLANHYTAYNEFNIPRMIDMTAECVGDFFRHLAAQSPDLVAALLENPADIPPCVYKLVDKPIEIWAGWSMV